MRLHIGISSIHFVDCPKRVKGVDFMSDRACWTPTAAAVPTGQTWGRRLQDCNGADALVGQFPDKFSTEGWHCLEDRVHRREGVYRRND
jgi:hypothetical protein